jgi:hypothetical protein
MSQLPQLRPTKKGLVRDLVREAGVDVRDWSRFSGGKARSASNPKYCYEWSFMEPGRAVVLNLWHDELEERGRTIFKRLNMRRNAAKNAQPGGNALWQRRSESFDSALQLAAGSRLPVQVILCDGRKRPSGQREAKASRVTARELDSVTWAVTAYDSETGDCTITRGAQPKRLVRELKSGDTHRLRRQRDVSLPLTIEDEQRALQAIETNRSLRQGKMFSPVDRKAIERYGMEKAKRWLNRVYGGYRVVDVSRFRSCDLICVAGNKQINVEVKCTQSTGSGILLTRHEVELARHAKNRTILVVVSHVSLSHRRGVPVVSGGRLRALDPWRLRPRDLTPAIFDYILPKR